MTTGRDSLSLERFTATVLDSARGWADLPADERRRRATLAAQYANATDLWSLTEAHTYLYGRAVGGLSPRTARSYREGGARFVEYALRSGVSLIRPEPDAGPLYTRTLEAAGLSPSSVRVHLASVRALYRALRWAGVTPLDPFSDTRPAPDKTAPWDKRHPYSEAEVQGLLAAGSLRDQALLLLCAHAGLRIAEALDLHWNDLEGDRLTVRRGKGGKLRRVKCSPSLQGALAALRTEITAPDAPVIGATQTAARQRLRLLAKKAGVTYRGWHALRHYAGTRLVAQTGSLEHAARHLGHSSIETTRVYAKWSDQTLNDALAGW